MTEDYPRHFNTGHWRAQLVTSRATGRGIRLSDGRYH